MGNQESSISSAASRGDSWEGYDIIKGKLHGQGRYIWGNGDIYEGPFINGQADGSGVALYRQDDPLRRDRYLGEFKEGRSCGKGVLKYRNGDEYKGEFVQGLHDGKGRLDCASGDWYDGEWSGGMKNGKGVWYGLATGEKYDGEWKDDERHGRGKVVFADDFMGRVWYDGEWNRGKKDGVGELRFIGRAFYKGAFKDDLYDGQGELVTENGNKFKGEFRVGLKVYGEQVYANGDVYVGEFKDQKRHGKGKFERAGGEYIYEGMWEKGKAHGKGIMKLSNGEEYEGDFFQDQWGHGEGTYRYSNSAIYQGKWENGRRHGFGVYTFPNGNKFEGNWKDDLQDGHGIITYISDAEGRKLAHAETFEGEWRCGEIESKRKSFRLAALLVGKLRVITAAREAFDEIQKIKRDSANSKVICLVCLENCIDTIFLECSHMVCCHHCGFNQKQCPKCAQEISRCIRTYTT